MLVLTAISRQLDDLRVSVEDLTAVVEDEVVVRRDKGSSAATILISSSLGFPLSTTQVTSGSVVGAGLGKRLASVHWPIVGRIALAWIITLPAAALVGGLAAWAASASTLGLIAVVVLALAAGIGFVVLARRKPVSHANVNDDESTKTPEPAMSAASER